MENKNTKSEMLEVRITAEMDREIKKLAKRQGRTESEITRGLLEEYIRKYETGEGANNGE